MLRHPRRVACAAALLSAACALPASASAADPAPTLNYAFGLDGQPASSVTPIGVSPDGREVLFDGYDSSGVAKAFVRNVATGTTSLLIPSFVTAEGWTAYPQATGASLDAQKVLYVTWQRIDPADTNDDNDAYVLDRRTGLSTLVSRSLAAPNAAATQPGRAFISGDGNSVVYDTGQGATGQVLRYDLATRAVTLVGPGTLARNQYIGGNGSSVVTSAGLVHGGHTWPVAPNTRTYGDPRMFRASPDGSAEATITADGFNVVDTATGARHLVDESASAALVGVSDGGTTVTVTGIESATNGFNKAVVQRITVATGAVAQVGIDAPYSGPLSQAILTPNDAFLINSTQISAIGAIPLPAAVPAPTDYLKVYPGCSPGSIFAPGIKPSIVLGSARIGPDPREPVGATVKVTIDATGKVANTFTTPPSQPSPRYSLNTGWGGFTITATVEFSDGTKYTGTKKVAPYVPIKNDAKPFSSAPTKCKTANGL